jgi:deazaflavin-dependent oxidoreductase (nitroreductase family)
MPSTESLVREVRKRPHPLAWAALGASAVAFPLTQALIARIGRVGAMAVEGVAGGLLLRDAILVRRGTPQRLRRWPAALLWLEIAAASCATVTGIVAVRRPAGRVDGSAAGLLEAARRASVSVLFGLHTVRFWIYLQPDRGRLPVAAEAPTEPGAGSLSAGEGIALWLHRSADRWLTPLGVALMRRTRGGPARLWNVNALLLTTRGRRSGRPRTVVLQYFPDDGAMVVAATNDGGSSHPGWYFNLRSAPAAEVEIGGRRLPVRAEELSLAEAAAWWERILQVAPDYERYSRAAGRTFPVVRLVPEASVGG